ncbi:hypothetical protein RJT34_01421 [Clitoria ternatea]|uniref:Uncharacterized protein n=1 Tax=Clitoria ternatea TaxID=43366 RepID=A0AAN9KJE3_CLITE
METLGAFPLLFSLTKTPPQPPNRDFEVPPSDSVGASPLLFSLNFVVWFFFFGLSVVPHAPVAKNITVPVKLSSSQALLDIAAVFLSSQGHH